MRNRTRCLWVSCSYDLRPDLVHNLREVGSLSEVYQPQTSSEMQLPEHAVLFCTYNTFVTKNSQTSFVERLLVLLGGKQFDGLIVLDECHKAKNYMTKGGATKTSVAIVTLQKTFKMARIIYCSATAMTEPEHIAYMERLGIWGRGTRFDSARTFVDVINLV